MGVLDFLFEGNPPKSVTTYGQTVSSMPTWYSDYTQGLIARANAIAGEPYQPYQGPRVAQFNQDQSNAFDLTRSNVGSWSPYMSQAGALTTSAGNTNPLETANPYFSSASQTAPSQIQSYMDPYVGNVIDRASLEAQRFYNEKLSPSLTNQFAGAGQYGSSAHLRAANQGARDLTEGLNSQAQAALSQAYQSGVGAYQTDAARLAQLGQAAGNLATQGAQLELGAGQQLGALGESLQGLNARDAAALDAIGQTQQQQSQKSLDLAYQDFLNQLNYPKEQTSWLSDLIRGLPTSQAQTTTKVGPADAYQPSPLAQLASLYTGFRGLGELNKSARGGRVKRYARGGRVQGALSQVTTYGR